MAEHPSAEGTVTTTQLARLLLLSERRIQQLVRAGILKHAVDEDTGRELRGRFRFVQNLHSYLRYQRGELGSDDVTEIRYLDARSRRMSALAAIEEARVSQIRGELHRADDIEFVITQIFTAVKAKLLALPSRTARLLIAKTDFAEILSVLQREIELALTELTAIDRSMFAAQNEAYLASLFPKRNGNGNGEHDALDEASD